MTQALSTITFDQSKEGKYTFTSQDLGFHSTPQQLLEMFDRGIDIIRFKDTATNRFIEDKETKCKLLTTLCNSSDQADITTTNHFFKCYLVCCRHQQPCKTAYHYLYETHALTKGIIQIIISLTYNRFEDISYIPFHEKEEPQQRQQRMNLICDRCLVRFPRMSLAWKDWIVKEICLTLDEEQTGYMRSHIIQHQQKWNRFIADMMEGKQILDGVNWMLLSTVSSQFVDDLEIPSQRVFDAIKVFWSRKDLSDLRILLQRCDLRYDHIEVWMNITGVGEYSLGFFWHLMRNTNVQNERDLEIWNIFNAFLRNLYDKGYTVWYKMCIEEFLCKRFFRFIGSLKAQKNAQCVANTLPLVKEWKSKVKHLSPILMQALFLVQCFHSCNKEIFGVMIDEGVLDIELIKSDCGFCVTQLFDAFEGTFPFIQRRRYNAMLMVCGWLYKNECGAELDEMCVELTDKIKGKIEALKEETTVLKWNVVLQKLKSLQKDWKMTQI